MSSRRYIISRNITIFGIFIKFFLGVYKTFVGLYFHSSAVVADGLHSLTDLFCDFFVLIAVKFGNKEADLDHPYGHKRIETFATFFLGIFLVLIAVWISYSAILTLIEGSYVVPSPQTFWAAIVSILLNEVLFFVTLSASKKVHSELLKANAWHGRIDSISSLIVLLGLVFSKLGYHFLEPVAAIVVSIFIAKLGLSWAIKTFQELIDSGLDLKTINRIYRVVKKVDGVKSAHQLRSRLMANEVFLDIHILIDPELSASEGHFIAENVRFVIMKNFKNIKDVTVHVDVFHHDEGFPKINLPNRTLVLENIKAILFKKLHENNLKKINIFYKEDSFHVEVVLKDLDKISPSLLTELRAELNKSLKEFKQMKKIDILSLY